jgi:hypothetical protein
MNQHLLEAILWLHVILGIEGKCSTLVPKAGN